jgi:hypothetical protein
MLPDTSNLRLLPEGGLLNALAYRIRRDGWLLDPRNHVGSFDSVPVDRPIFLLGFQGGGTTLVSRILRRNRRAVSVTGNHEYWSGAGEMHTVLGPTLPQELTGTVWKPLAPDHRLDPPRSWSYATDELLPHYRETAADASRELAKELKRVLRMCLARQAKDTETARFTDKSQVYTVRAGLLDALLDGHDPRFVLLLMNPYIACYKSAKGKAADMERYKSFLSLEERLELCAQHWTNSVEAALEDVSHKLHIVRFEDVLREPAEEVQQVCDHVDLEFDPDMLPQAHHELPLGSRFRDRWYPLEPDRPMNYLDELWDSMGVEGIEIIRSRCGKYAEKFGYEARI